jgi:hypothetical protein
VTVTPARRFEVSRRIRDEFENGRDYYAMHDNAIRVPDRSELQPDPDALRWHNENRFLGELKVEARYREARDVYAVPSSDITESS